MSSKTQTLSFRWILVAMTMLVVSLALLVTGALVAFTTILHTTTFNAARSVESVRLAQEAQIDVLLHSRASDALLRRDIEERLMQRLSDARGFVSSEDEKGIIQAAEVRAGAYITAARAGTSPDLVDSQEAAYGALEALVGVNVAQAREASSVAALWDERANYAGLSAALVLLFSAAAVLLWLKRWAFESVFSLASAMEKFGRGDREARAPETGPTEVLEMSRRFNEMASALATQNQARVAFLGGVAHDLRNPLSVLKMSVSLVSPDSPLPPEPRLRRLIETIGRQITRLDRMAGDFLDLAKIEAGQLELRLDVHDACELVRQALELFDATLPKPRLRVSLPQEAVPLYCDNLRIEQVLINLVSNAIKYSAAGSPVEVAVEMGVDEVALRVTDHGLGIAEADQERVFDPFRRVGLSRETVPGVGLGLFVVRHIVEAHGGRIELQSTPGAGSTFRAYLPQRHAVSSARVVPFEHSA